MFWLRLLFLSVSSEELHFTCRVPFNSLFSTCLTIRHICTDLQGIAGLKCVKKQTPFERRGGDGGETSGSAAVVSGVAAVANGVAGAAGAHSTPVVSSDSRPPIDRHSEPSAIVARDSSHLAASSRIQAESERTDAVDEVAGRISHLNVRGGLRQRHRPAQASDNQGLQI